jgi:signal transduction histidine kinase
MVISTGIPSDKSIVTQLMIRGYPKIGLYVVKNIVEAHGGRIWIESQGEGQGTRFVIELPKEHREGGV